jgi:hypothetical protein
LKWNKASLESLPKGRCGVAASAVFKVYEHPMSSGKSLPIGGEKLSIREAKSNV